MVKKAELHVHLEGTAPPALVRKMAARNGAKLDPTTFKSGGEFAWSNFWEFLDCYDKAAATILTKDDYRLITYDYLARCAKENTIYVEMFSSPDHAAEVGMSYTDHLEGIAAGIDDARLEFGIEGRIIVTCVRHLGAERALAIARLVALTPHPYVVGFGMGGDESRFHPDDFAAAFNLVTKAGYQTTSHAGEFSGPESIRASLAALPISRVGHGVRAIEDPELLEELAYRRIPLELCPGSNIATGLYKSWEKHPFRKFMDTGCLVTLNSDDPPYFGTSIGHEYEQAAKIFGLSKADLKNITRNAISAAFCGEELKEKLLSCL
ncbi:adenosine deaminase [uncultured Sneathiella sp.]|jgi:adenosine deaminase|uniref:adenosine deaminase n=1 Tax=uncultured Sneathiella sp. TaxID=879315 RepID=UPI0030D7CD73|tara:strand:+ start:41144 stop:42109 length:966 start_codon:yes stop_codon:yes gene_type:complete